MKKIALYTIFILIANVALLYLISFLADKIDNQNIGDSIATILGLIVAAAIAQLIVALILLAIGKKTEIAKAMLLALGIIFLIGISICTGMWS